MVIRPEQVEAMGRTAFLLRMHGFLSERVRLAAVREALSDRERVYTLWNRVLDRYGSGPEYRSAILLSYALCQECSGSDGMVAVRRLLAGNEPEYEAKCYFEDAKALRFSEFDVAATRRKVEKGR